MLTLVYNKLNKIKENSYPLNLYYALNERCENALPQEPSEDNIRGLEIALTYLTPIMRDILLYRYRNCLSYNDIGEYFNLTGSRIDDLADKALKKLSDRRNLKIIECGLHGYIDYNVKTKLEAQEAIIMQKAYKKGYEAGFADAKNNREAALRECGKAAKISIEELDLPIRPYNCLIKAGYKTVYDVLNLSLSDIKQIKNLGRYGRKEIALALDKLAYINDVWKEWL